MEARKKRVESIMQRLGQRTRRAADGQGAQHTSERVQHTSESGEQQYSTAGERQLADDGAAGGAKRRERAGESEEGRQSKMSKQDGKANLHPRAESAPGASRAGGQSGHPGGVGGKRRVREGDGRDAGERKCRRGGEVGEGPGTRAGGRKREREEQAHEPIRILRGAAGPSS